MGETRKHRDLCKSKTKVKTFPSEKISLLLLFYKKLLQSANLFRYPFLLNRESWKDFCDFYRVDYFLNAMLFMPAGKYTLYKSDVIDS